MAPISVMALFVGGPLQGTTHEWADPPAYHPHFAPTGMVPYSRRKVARMPKGADVIYAPVGMSDSAIALCIAQLPKQR